MDPLSIVASAAGIYTAVHCVYKALSRFIRDARTVDETIQSLYAETGSLQGMIEAIRNCVESPSIRKDEPFTVWQNIHASILACEKTMQRFAQILDKVNASQKLFRTRSEFDPIKQLRIDMKADELESLRKEIRTHEGALHMALLVINIRINSQTPTIIVAELGPKLDQVINSLKPQQLAAIEDEMVQKSAYRMRETAIDVASSASVIVSSRSTIGARTEANFNPAWDQRPIPTQAWYSAAAFRNGSEIGEPLNVDKIVRIHDWIPDSTIPVVHEDNSTVPTFGDPIEENSSPVTKATSHTSNVASVVSQQASTPPKTNDEHDSDSDDDLEQDLLDCHVANGMEHMVDQEFGDAEGFFLKAVEAMSNIPVRRQRQSQVQHIKYCTAFCCFQQGKLENAERLCEALRKSSTQTAEDRTRVFDAAFLLALIHLHKGRLSAAEVECRQVIKGRKKFIGVGSSYHESIALMAIIKEVAGDVKDARSWSKMLPEGFNMARFRSSQLLENFYVYSQAPADQDVAHRLSRLSIPTSLPPYPATLETTKDPNRSSVSSSVSSPAGSHFHPHNPMHMSTSISSGFPGQKQHSMAMNTLVPSPILIAEEPSPPAVHDQKPSEPSGDLRPTRTNTSQSTSSTFSIATPTMPLVLPAQLAAKPSIEAIDESEERNESTSATNFTLDTRSRTSEPDERSEALEQLRARYHVFTQDRNFSTNETLAWAARYGEVKIVKLLLSDWKPDPLKSPFRSMYSSKRRRASVNSRTTSRGHENNLGTGWTPLHYAAHDGHGTIIDLLIDAGAEVEAQTLVGATPLYWAVVGCHVHAASRLLSRGAVINWCGPRGLTPLMAAAQQSKPTVADMIDALIRFGATVDLGDKAGDTALHHAVRGNSIGAVLSLVAGGADVNASNLDGSTPLIEAATRDERLQVLEALLDSGADLELADKFGHTALLKASRCAAMAAATVLIDRGANIEATNRPGSTALLVAAVSDNLDMIKLLVNRSANVKAANNEGVTALMQAARTGENVSERLTFLIRNGAEIDAGDKNGTTALMYAVANGKKEAVRTLLASGADKNLRGINGRTAAQWARDSSYHDIRKLIGNWK